MYLIYLLPFHRANDIAKEHKRKKVTEPDMYQALNELGFDKYVEELKDFMKNYRDDQAVRVQQSKKRTRDDEGAHDGGAGELIDASGVKKGSH